MFDQADRDGEERVVIQSGGGGELFPTGGCVGGTAIRQGATGEDIRGGQGDGGCGERLSRVGAAQGIPNGHALLRAFHAYEAVVRVGDEEVGWGGFDDGECARIFVRFQGRDS